MALIYKCTECEWQGAANEALSTVADVYRCPDCGCRVNSDAFNKLAKAIRSAMQTDSWIGDPVGGVQVVAPQGKHVDFPRAAKYSDIPEFAALEDRNAKRRTLAYQYYDSGYLTVNEFRSLLDLSPHPNEKIGKQFKNELISDMSEPNELLEILRRKEEQFAADSRHIPMPPAGRMKFPKQLSEETAYWVGESVSMEKKEETCDFELTDVEYKMVASIIISENARADEEREWSKRKLEGASDETKKKLSWLNESGGCSFGVSHDEIAAMKIREYFVAKGKPITAERSLDLVRTLTPRPDRILYPSSFVLQDQAVLNCEADPCITDDCDAPLVIESTEEKDK